MAEISQTFTHPRCRGMVGGTIFFFEGLSVNRTRQTNRVNPSGRLLSAEVTVVGVTVTGSINRVMRVVAPGGDPSDTVAEGLAPSLGGSEDDAIKALSSWGAKDINLFDVVTEKEVARIVKFHLTGDGLQNSPNSNVQESLSFEAINYLNATELGTA